MAAYRVGVRTVIQAHGVASAQPAPVIAVFLGLRAGWSAELQPAACRDFDLECRRRIVGMVCHVNHGHQREVLLLWREVHIVEEAPPDEPYVRVDQYIYTHTHTLISHDERIRASGRRTYVLTQSQAQIKTSIVMNGKGTL